MEQIIQQLKGQQKLINQLTSYIFEYSNCLEFDTDPVISSHIKKKLNETLYPNNECGKLILLQIKNQFHYLKEEELTNEQINIYKLNHTLADLELSGYIKQETLYLLTNEQISLKEYSEK